MVIFYILGFPFDNLRNQLHKSPMSFFGQVGKIALGTRVRFFGEKVSAEAAEIYQLYGINMNPKWFPVFYILSKSSEKTVTSIAEAIGHSHASVSKIVTEMKRAGLVLIKTSNADRRCTNLCLSKKGKQIASQIEMQYKDVGAAMNELSSQATYDLWKALEEWESLLSQRSLLDRVREQKKLRESAAIQIIPYRKEYKEVFRTLNEQWIRQYFKMEQPDHDALDHPEKYILKKGGLIFVATLNEEPVGVCALLKRSDEYYPYELAKMAVATHARGKNIGWLLAQAVIDKARELKAKRLFVESNTVLKPAISLYRKLGFEEVAGPKTPYARCNIQMELKL